MGTSYRDPMWGRIEAGVEAKLGLPQGLLSAIRTKGERSNSDQVSEAGAKTVYQVIPSTRAAFLKRYGVDAYASPQNAAMVAGLHLKESLERTGGNTRRAVAEYVGGTDPSNWGKTVAAYVKRVTGGGDPASARSGPSTFDRVAARTEAGPSLEKVYQSYRSGQMPAQDRAAFENAVNNGQIVLRPGWRIDRKPSAPVLPQALIDAYNSHRMDDDPEARKIVEETIARGEASLPRGQRLHAPPPRTLGDRMKGGLRTGLTWAGKAADIVAGPANAIVNALPGNQGLSVHPFGDAANSASDALGLPAPESDSEKLIDNIGGGAVMGLATAGAGLATAGLRGVAGAVGKALASNPLLDTVSGAASGGSQESARQAGAGPVGQIAAGLVGGALPIGLAGATERVLARRTLPQTVADTPRSAVLDEQGNLTPHGQEIAVQHGVGPEDIRQAYEAPPSVREATANDQMPEAVAREATNDAPVAARPSEAEASTPPPARAAPDDVPVTPLARVQEGQDFGVDMSRGQATKSFDIQDREQQLKNSNGPAGEKMRQFVAKQTEQVKQAVEKFRKGFGDTEATPEQRGAIVQDAVRELLDNGKAGVNALYRAARDLGQEVPLETAPIRDAYERLMVEADVPDQVKNVLTQEAARYGIIGKVAGTAENKITTVKIDDGNGGTRPVKFYGEPESLRLDNAEAFRQAVSKQYMADGPQKLTTVLRKAVDDAVEQAADNLATGKSAAITAAMRKARDAHIEQVKTFRAKDVVQKIADWKKGQEDVTGLLTPEQVIKTALASTSDLKRIKAVLLSKPTVASKAAWRAIQAHGLAQVFEKATTRNTNAAGEITEAISGAKLRSAISGFPPDKLKVLLEPKDFNTLMKLRRVIEDVTIPISGTVNTSNSGNLIMRLVKDVDNQVTAAFAAAGTAIGGPVGAAVGGTIGRTISPAVKAVKQAKVEAETLSDATAYSPARAAAEGAADKPSAAVRARQTAADSLRAFIDTYSSPRVLAPVLVSTEGATQ